MTLRRTLTTLVVLGATAAPAQAQNGVTVDPGSPSGKEYAIPLDSARRAAAGTTTKATGKAAPSGTSAPLFGEGVGDAQARPSGRPRPGGSSRSQPRSRTKPRNGASPQPASTAVAAVHRASATVPDGGSSALTIGAVAVSVLLLGAVVGSIARRRSS